jgi:hypothetical protein
MHRWIGTDNGSQCYRCGIALDYGATDGSSGCIDWTDPRTAAESDAAHNLAPWCHEPTDDRAHHYVLEGIPRPADPAWPYVLSCAYGDSVIGPDTLPADIAVACIGA